MANILTGIRILCGLFILFFPPFSGWYYALYLLAGFTDAIDGTVARKTGTESAFGAKFDTVADFIFAISIAVKLLNAFVFPLWLWLWIGVIALIKIGSHVAGYIKYHELKTVHSLLNKICGGIVFIIPLIIGCSHVYQVKSLIVIAACILTTVAAIAEGMAILKNK